MSQIKNRGWQVAMAGLGINLALGILYTWSVFKLAIKGSISSGDGMFTWDMASLNDPYAVCCIVFAFAMIPAGRMQDKLGPRVTATIGGVLTGLGLLLASLSSALWVWILGFGVLMGTGLGFGYASATPPAIKWFPASKTGMIAGIVVAGFGLASVYIAPLAKFLIGQVGLSQSMMIFGGAFLVVVSLLSQFLVNPPAGFKAVEAGAKPNTTPPPVKVVVDMEPKAMLRTRRFWVLWFIYAVGSGAGLMIIGSVAGMASASLGEMAWLVVALMAVGNAGGRVAAGIISDKLGRAQTMAVMLSFQGLIMFGLLYTGTASVALIVTAATLIGFNYGTNLSLFPSATKDFFGIKNFGANYGLVFTAWGVGGLILPRISQMIEASTGSLEASYILAGLLLFMGAGMTVLVGKPDTVAAERTMPAAVGAGGGS